ncbi:MAG: hypothetical protein OXC66_13230, partial [Roseovarius sp.]|nr:hypothetical protein [Roseovarius sp.]
QTKSEMRQKCNRAKSDCPASYISRRLGAISYAEAEEFILDVRRRDVMTMKEIPLKKTIEEQLKFWQKRVHPIHSHDAEQSLSDG